MFSGLQAPIPPQPVADVFYDMSVHLSDIKWWSDTCPDTNTLANWSVLYEELWMGHYDTNKMTGIDTFWTPSEVYGDDTLPIGLLDYSFHKLKDSALLSDKYFIIDGNGLLIDNFKFKYNGGTGGNPNDVTQWAIDYSFDPNPIYQNADSSSPYKTSNLFSVALFKSITHSRQVTYVIDPALIKIGPHTLPSYIADFSLRIDFGDGQGYVTVDHTQKQFVTINYGMGGEKVIKAGYFNGQGNQLKSSRAAAQVADVQKVLPDQTININGLNVGIYSGCKDANDPNFREKFIIYLEGIDVLENVGISSIYTGIKTSGLAELRNHGYSFVVVDWQSSTISLEINADYVINLIDYLKCNYLTNGDKGEQFIVIGESMGGLIGRYALRKMETMSYGPTACHANLTHNTRLFISYDAPQAGAYIPLSAQHFVSNRSILGAMYAYNMIANRKLEFKFLYSDAAQQLLLYHTNSIYNPVANLASNTISSFTQASPLIMSNLNYLPSPKRVLFLNDLDGMGNDGYPMFCKKMAISNGLLSGDKQLNREGGAFTPGSGYLNATGDVKYTILGIETSLISVDFDLNSLDASGAGLVYRHEMGMKFWKPQIVWQTIIRPFRVRIFGTTYTVGHTVRVPVNVIVVFDYLVSKGRQEYANGMEPLDNGPGGFYDTRNIGNEYLNQAPISNGFSLTQNNVTSVSCYGQPTNPFNNPAFEIFSAKYNLTICSQVDRFNFIPTFSAIDYGYNRTLPLAYDYDILSDNITTKLSRTPFDVFMGLAPEPNYPTQPKDFGQNIYHTSSMLNFELFDTSMYRLQNGERMYLLNREIGEDTLLLSNLMLNRPAEFSSFDYIKAGNALNPFYEYNGVSQQYKFDLYDKNYDIATHQKNHIYSKNNPVMILGGNTAEFYYPAPTNSKYSDVGIIGDTSLNPGPTQFPCNESSFKKSVFWKVADDELDETPILISYYPNPVGQILNIDVHVNKEILDCNEIEQNCKGKVSFYLYNLEGRLIISDQFNITSGKNKLNFNVNDLSLPTGTYLLKGILKNEVSHFKIVVQ